MNKLVKYVAGAGILYLYACVANAQDDVVSISTTVKGNQEHPSVTYIVPWRQAADETVLEMPFNTRTRLVDVFDHVDKQEHVREVDYLINMRSAPAPQAD